MSELIAEQPNGERIRYERWVYESWMRGTLRDPFLARPLVTAIAIYEPGARWKIEGVGQ